jgi:hypothetical protein
MSPVTPLFADTQPGPEAAEVGPTYVEMAKAIAAICATRILLLISVVTGSAIWGYAVIDPTRDRLYAAGAYSIVFVLPQILLYLKKG